MKRTLSFMLVICFMLTGALTFAQQRKITGKIVGDDGLGVPATVQIKGTTKGAAADIDGNYSIQASKGQTLVYSSIGYTTKEVIVGDGNVINLTLPTEATKIDEAVVVGFGTQKKANLTGAVSSVDVNKTFANKPITDVSKGLQGVVPGLNIAYTTNDQGSAPSIKIRGTGSINGSSKPLILLDGVEIDDLSFVNPDNIASISVLKDAASSSIYGTRAAYGVVLIKSKDGSEVRDNVRINYSANFTWEEPINLPKYCTGYNVLDQLNESILAQKNTDGTDIEAFGMYYKDLYPKIENWLDNYLGKDLGPVMVYGRDYEYSGSGVFQGYRIWDPNKELLKSTAFKHAHNLSIAGNSGKTNYNISVGYNKEDGLMKAAKEQYVQRFNASISTNTQLYKWLNVGTKVMYTEKTQKYPFGYSKSDSSGGLYYYNMRFPTFFPYGISDGGYPSTASAANQAKAASGEGLYFRHGNGYVAYAPTCNSSDQWLRIGANMKIDFTENFSFYADYTRGQLHYKNNTIAQPQYVANWWSAWAPRAAYSSSNYIEHTLLNKTSNTYDAYFDYNMTLWNDHNFAFKLGMNAEDLTYDKDYLYSQFLINPTISTIGQTQNANGKATVDQTLRDRATAGFFGRINYNYKEKLLLEVNGRYDGSSQFRKSKKWAFFPSFSAGYRISQEEFMKNQNIFSNLKLRGSYGFIGNQDVGSDLDWYRYVATIGSTTADWLLQSGLKPTATGMPSVVNSDMTWEKISTLDFGVDMSFLHNELNVTFDWYQRRNKGMLVARNAVAGQGGFPSLPQENNGDLRTNGWELQVDYRHTFSNGLSLYGTATLSDAKAKITKWNTSTGLLTGNYEGKELGEIWGFKTANGYFTADEVANGVQTVNGLVSIYNYQGKALQKDAFVYGEGDIKYQDVNGDGTVNTGLGTISDHGDLVRIGNSMPRYEYSLRLGAAWKGFDFEVLFQGVGKRSMWTTSSLFLPHVAGAQMNIFSNQLDYYTPDNPNAKFPRPYIGQTGSSINGLSSYTGYNNFYPQTKYLADMSYLRVKNVTIGYTFPEKWMHKLYIQKLRIYGSVSNLLTFDNIDGVMDPEMTGGWSTVSGIDTQYAGRATPFTRGWSFGVQVTF